MEEKYESYFKGKQVKFRESKRSTKETLAFLVSNSELINEFDLDSVYFNTMSKKFKKEFDVFLETDKFGRFSSEDLGFKTSVSTYEELVKAFEAFRKTSGISPEDEKIKQNFSSLKSHLYYTGKGIFKYSTRYFYFYELFYVLFYVCKGVLYKDYKESNLLWDKYRELIENPNKFQTSAYDFAPAKFKVDEFGVEVTIMKNGKLIVKGLSSKEEQRLAYLYKVLGVQI